MDRRVSRSAGAKGAIAALLVLACFAAPACSPGPDDEAETGPRTTTLDGDRLPENSGQSTEPPIDFSKAPTDAHRRLGQLLPTTALLRDSILYAGWDGNGADFADEAPEDAMLPVVTGRYGSSSFQHEVDESGTREVVTRDQPQFVDLFLIRCPDNMAAQVVARAIQQRVLRQGFDEREPAQLAGGGDRPPMISRFVATEEGEESDKVYVAYIKTVGDLVIYALQSQTTVPLVDRDGNRIRLTYDSEAGTGANVGAQVITLLLSRLNP